MMMPVPLRGLGRPHRDNTPDELHVSVLTGRCKRIKTLLRKGVHIESVNCHGQTPLFCASWGGDTEVVTLLLRLGANPNRRCGTSGATPVHAASYRGSRRVLRLLIETGADLSAKDNDNLTPRDYAEKQPSPIRRHKILSFLDLLLGMTLHRTRPVDPLRGHDSTQGGAPPMGTTIGRRADTLGSNMGRRADTLGRRSPYLSTTDGDSRRALNKSALNLSANRKSIGSVTSVWAACVGAGELPKEAGTKKQLNSTGTLHKTVSCHLVDQLCVTTSLPLLSPNDLTKATHPGDAYTCGGPTVYSPHTWLGTPVTVRRPTPALSYSSKNKALRKPDQDAVLSLLEELSILRRLRHPAFLEVMAACHVPDPDHVTLVFQHVPYGSLYHHLHVMHRDLSVCGAVEVLVGVVEGLLFLHAHGWLHSGLSSHALHLVSTNHAKLGSFQHAIQQQAKGECSMKAEHLDRAAWLVPWQAPEIVAESMVSVKSEVYALTAIIWELWAGMPPWSGVSEDEIRRRVNAGETIPYLAGTPPSLVVYLTQYGLKWNAHERDLDLHEIHTMLRSLRVQVDEDDRVPSVPSWGPPSVPNTPVVGRLVQQGSNEQNNNKNDNMNSSRASPSRCPVTSSVRSSSEIHPSQYLQFATIDRPSSSSSCSSVHVPVTRTGNFIQTPPATVFTLPFSSKSELPKEGLKATSVRSYAQVHVPATVSSSVGSLPADKTAAHNPTTTTTATHHTDISSKGSSFMITSTPKRPTSSVRTDLPPDLLPSKYVPHSYMPVSTPDVIARGKQHVALHQSTSGVRLRHYDKNTLSERDSYISNKMSAFEADKVNVTSDSDIDSNQDFAYITNSAKRAFFTDSECSSKSPSPTNERVKPRRHRASIDSGRHSTSKHSPIGKVKERGIYQKHSFDAQDTKGGPIRADVVRRGLSLSNLLNIGVGSMVTRTFSHVSLCSAESSATSSTSSVADGRRPQRTISQVTLTFKKLSAADSSSSSSRDELEQASKENVEDKSKSSSRYRRSKSLPKSPQHTKSPRQWEDVTGIKPASHQLTRHSSSCSLSSGGPPSPVHQFVNPAVRSKHGSLPTSPQHQPSTSGLLRPTSMYGTAIGTFGSSMSIGDTPSIRVNARRHSDAPKPRPRRLKKKHDIEPEEEFIDDEFNASLYEQPHMQLSVGSSENLLETRLTASSMMADDSVPVAFQSISSRGLSIPPYGSTLNALQENSDEDLSLTLAQSTLPTSADQDTAVPHTQSDPVDVANTKSNQKCSNLIDVNSPRRVNNILSKSAPIPVDNSDSAIPVDNSDSTIPVDTSDSDSLLSCSPSRSDFSKDYEPLKSVQLLRNMSQSLSLYLPKYSIGSDSEIENL